MIRKMEPEDTSKCCNLLMDNLNEWGSISGTGVSEPTVIEMLEMYMSRSSKVVLVNDDLSGLIMGGIFKWPLNLEKYGLQEIICVGENRDELRDALDLWGKKSGCEAAVMSCFEKSASDRIRRL